MIVKEPLGKKIEFSVMIKKLHTNFNRIHLLDVNIFLNQGINTYVEVQGNLELTDNFF